jgi:DNA-binding NarL/FixJ family response regulator
METRTAKYNEEVETLKTIRYSLTNREFLIFKFLAEGKTNKEIATILFVEVSTVKTHINNLYAKIKCKNRKEAKEKWQGMSQNY